jgi:CRISPR-associated protein Cmr3
MKTFALTPLDAWFFRDGRPYEEKEANQADVVSGFPPPARTLSGALRAALARANGWSGRGRWPDALNEAFGSGPDDLGALQFTGPLLISNNEALWPLPRHVLGRIEEAWTPRAFLRPARARTPCDSDELNLPVIALPPGEMRNGLKHAETAWVTTAGLSALLAGELPKAEAIVDANKLWAHEPRVGLRRDEDTLATDEGALYSPSYVRLHRGVALGVSVAGLPDAMSGVPEIFPLGGESRLARCDAWSGEVLPAPVPRGRFSADSAGRVAFTVVLLTPGRFTAPDLPGAEIISGCVGKPHFIGGWDSLKREPLPLQPFAPAGSVWFCTAAPADFDAVFARHGQHLGPHAAHGFGQIAIGLWPTAHTQ